MDEAIQLQRAVDHWLEALGRTSYTWEEGLKEKRSGAKHLEILSGDMDYTCSLYCLRTTFSSPLQENCPWRALPGWWLWQWPPSRKRHSQELSLSLWGGAIKLPKQTMGWVTPITQQSRTLGSLLSLFRVTDVQHLLMLTFMLLSLKKSGLFSY